MVLTKIRTHIKWVLALFVIIFTVSIFFTYGMGGHKKSEGEGVRDHAVVSIDGKKLFLSDLQRHLQVFAEQQNMKLTPENMGELRKAVVNHIAQDIAITKEIKKRGITADPALVKDRLKQIEQNYVTREAFLAQLAATGSSVDKVKESLAHQIATEELLRQGVEQVKPDESKVKELYKVLKDLKNPVVYRAPGIEGNHAELTDESAAKALVAALRSGTSWAQALVAQGDKVKVHTDGNYTSFIPDSDLQRAYPELQNLNDGDISEPIKVPQGYLVFQRVRHSDEKYDDYETVKPNLEKLVVQQESAQRQAEFLAEITKSVEVKILDEEAFKPQPAPKDDEEAQTATEQVTESAAENKVETATEEQSVETKSAPATEPAKTAPQASKPTDKTVKGAKVGGEDLKDKLKIAENNAQREQSGIVTAKPHTEPASDVKIPVTAGEASTVGEHN